MSYIADIAFILCALLLGYFFLYRRYLRPLKKQFEKLAQMQQKFLGLFSDFEDMMDGFEEYVEELRGEFAKEKEEFAQYAKTSAAQSELTLEARQELEAMIEQCKLNAKSVREDVANLEYIRAEIKEERSRLDRMSKGAFTAVAPPAEMTVGNVQPLRHNKEKSRNPRHERVLSLYQEGNDATQIAQKTGFARGEVQLILEMRNQGS